MSDKLYTSIKTELTDPALESKINIDTSAEPQLADVSTDLYAAISTTAPEAAAQSEATTEEQTFSQTVSNRLYTQIIPEKPSVLAEERIFVYVPKVTNNRAGIARFLTEQFNIVDGEVSIKSSYLNNIILGSLLTLELVLIVTELPSVGIANKIYLVPNSTAASTGYIWNVSTNTWLTLGVIELNLTEYYTKAQIDELLNTVSSIKDLPIYNTLAEANADTRIANYAFIVSKTINI